MTATEKVMEEAESISGDLGGHEGWWKPETFDTLADAAYDMIEAGIEPIDVQVILGNVVQAIRSEYGE